MRLFIADASPFARKARVVTLESGLAGRVAFVPASATPLDSGTLPLAVNPLGKIPCLERDDGPALYDSRVICRYLDSLGGGKLYPEAPKLWESLTLEATGDGINDAAVAVVYEGRFRSEAQRHEGLVAGQRTKITRALDALEARWIAHLAGPVDIGGVAVAVALGYLDLRLADLDWRAPRPALAGWFARFAERPSMVATRPA